MTLIDILQTGFRIIDGTVVITSSYNWTTVMTTRNGPLLRIGSDSGGSFSSITQSGKTVTVTFVTGSTTNVVTITEDGYGTGFHKVDFSLIEQVGYFQLEFWDGYAFQSIKGARFIPVGQ